jgi:NADPH:quinone reductase-like Zn-dependent oxidoreductase
MSDLQMVRVHNGYQAELPASPGIEGVGLVEAVGTGVQGPIVGNCVVFVTGGTLGASRSCAQWTDLCPFEPAWTIRPPPPPDPTLLSDAEGAEDQVQDVVGGCGAGDFIERTQAAVQIQ